MTEVKEKLIKVDNLKKTYGKGETEFQALKGVSLDVFKGETVAIVGKSGSGKSTLMHLMALLDEPDAGSIVIEEQDSQELKTKELNILRNETFGFIFQQFFLNPGGTVLDNVELPLKIAGVGKRERRARAMEALRILELDSKAKNKATDLSGGQKQRVCIARALVNNPSVIFLDEPTGALDTNTSEVVENIVFNLNREQGITLVMVTHDPELAAKCDRQIVLRDGLIIETIVNTPTVKEIVKIEKAAENIIETVADALVADVVELDGYAAGFVVNDGEGK